MSRSTKRSRAMSSRSKRSGSGQSRDHSNVPARNLNAMWDTRPGYSEIFDPFPAKIRVRMRYSEVVAIDATVGFPGHYLFLANSIYDPNYSGTGHQPMGRDTYATLYNHYRVASSKITVTPTTAWNGSFGVGLSDDTTTSTEFDGIVENKGTKWAMNSSAGGAKPQVTNYFNANYYTDSYSGMSALVGANPTETMIFDVFCRGPDKTSDLASVSFQICMEFVVDLWELKDMTES